MNRLSTRWRRSQARGRALPKNGDVGSQTAVGTPAVALHPHLVYEDEATPGLVSLDLGSPSAARPGLVSATPVLSPWWGAESRPHDGHPGWWTTDEVGRPRRGSKGRRMRPRARREEAARADRWC
ncbi:unnamed protein product [Heligmosomoides polygyrus]|uniref:Peroxin/Ferlin domain-containing protein n=1 Tax=Heligmosomoides polygyrus TaxID=6339 RepID=A0A183GUS4_HELPZ|nr:unnamed protein product [Heligmosomoides polygyrus]